MDAKVLNYLRSNHLIPPSTDAYNLTGELLSEYVMKIREIFKGKVCISKTVWLNLFVIMFATFRPMDSSLNVGRTMENSFPVLWIWRCGRIGADFLLKQIRLLLKSCSRDIARRGSLILRLHQTMKFLRLN